MASGFLLRQDHAGGSWIGCPQQTGFQVGAHETPATTRVRRCIGGHLGVSWSGQPLGMEAGSKPVGKCAAICACVFSPIDEPTYMSFSVMRSHASA